VGRSHRPKRGTARAIVASKAAKRRIELPPALPEAAAEPAGPGSGGSGARLGARVAPDGCGVAVGCEAEAGDVSAPRKRSSGGTVSARPAPVDVLVGATGLAGCVSGAPFGGLGGVVLIGAD